MKYQSLLEKLLEHERKALTPTEKLRWARRWIKLWLGVRGGVPS
jgi:hypothetical protein